MLLSMYNILPVKSTFSMSNTQYGFIVKYCPPNESDTFKEQGVLDLNVIDFVIAGRVIEASPRTVVSSSMVMLSAPTLTIGLNVGLLTAISHPP